MNKTMKNLFRAALGCAFSVSLANAATITVNCPTDSLQAAIDAAVSGDTINVSGTCTENVLIRNEKSRFTINGQGTTTLTPLNTAATTLTIRGKGVLVQNMTISGGLYGVLINRGSSATLKNNTIQSASDTGVMLVDLAFATLIGNTIQNNAYDGILVSETSVARIGFDDAAATEASPNTFQNNGRYGIYVLRGSSARIYGNIVSSNGQGGIAVMRGSTADIASNTINANGTSWTSGSGGNGVAVSLGSYVTLGELGSTSFTGMPNITTVNNANAGIRCTMNSTIYGRLGTANQLNGTVSQYGGGSTANTFSSSCVTDLSAS